MGNIDQSDDQINQLEELRLELSFLKQSYNREVNDRKSVEFALQERLKELNCHNQISKLMATSEFSAFEVIEKIVQIIPPSWQFPEIAEALIVVYDQTFQTPNYKVSKHYLVQDIKVNGNVIGRVEVCYPDNLQLLSQQIFLAEEIDLLFSIAERIGNFIEKNEKDSVLRQSEEKFRNLVETISEIIYEFMADGTINYISPSVEKILGYQAKELVGQSVFDIIQPDDRPLFAERLNSVEIKGSSFHEYRFITKSGEIRWLSKSTTSIHKEGKLISRVGTLKDITEQQLAEISLRESETKYRILFNDSPDGYLIIQNGVFVDCNHSSEMMLNGDRSQILGKNPALVSPEFQPNGRLSSELVQERIQEVMTKGNISFEWIHQRFDGINFVAQVNISMIVLNDQPALFTSWKDITERKKAEEDILKANRLYAVISQVNQAIVYTKDKDKLLDEICAIAINFGKFRMAWIGLLDEESLTVKPAVFKGWEDGYLSHIKQISLSDSPEGQGPTANALREGTYFVCNDIENDPHMAPWKEEALKRGYRSSIGLPIKQSGKVIASFNLYSSVNNFFNLEEIKLLEEVAGDISFAFDAIEVDKERERAVQEVSKFRTITDQANYGSAISTLDGNIIYVNHEFARMHQREPEELIGKSLSIFHNPEQMPRVEETLELLKLYGKFSAEEVWRTRKDGSVFPSLMNASTIVDSNGIPQFLSATAIDITDKKLAEEVIKQQNERLNAIISAMPDLMFVVDKNGTNLEYYANHAERLLAPEDHFIGTNLKELFEAETADLHIRKINECIEQQNLVTYEYVMRSENTLLFFEARLAPLGDDRVLSFIREITDRKQKDIQIKKLSQAIEQSPVLVVVTDLNGSIEYVNEAFTKVTGYSQEEAKGKNPRILKSGQTEKSVYQDLWKTITAGKEWQGEWINRKKNGELYWESVSIAPIHDEVGEITNYIAVKQDITQRKQTEEQLNILTANLEVSIVERTSELTIANFRLKDEIEERKQISEALQVKTTELENFFSLALDLLCIADTSGNFIKLNKAWENILGYTTTELEHRQFLEFVHPDDLQATLSVMSELSEQHPIINFTNRYRAKDSSYRFIEWHASPAGNLIYAAARDITERIKSEEEMKQARTEAEQANLAKSEFLSRMSHELRTPMNAILGFAQLLDMGQLNPSQKKGVDHILHGGKHLLDLINEVLDISRIEAGRLSLSAEPVKLSEVLLEMIDTIQPLANTRQVQLNLIDSSVNSEFIRADRQRLKQVLMNLINNAVKYNNTGGSIYIRTEIMPARDDKEYIRISVTDTGYGIREEDIPKLFKPFERIGAEFTGAEGSGLGLTVVKKLMDAMQGDIGLESKFGEGSTFWIELQHVESPLKNIEKANVLAQSGLESGIKKGTILCIEDNLSNIELVEQILSSQRPGIQLIVNTNGKSTVDLAVMHQPDLILLDLNLPDIHGMDVLKMLMADDRTIDIPVVVISADAMPQQLEGLLKNGAKKYMTKPLDVSFFLNTIDTYIVS